MEKRPPPLTAPYSAYNRKNIEFSYEELTLVSRGTPCGEYLRRFWQPIIIAAELKDVPISIRIMGEDLIVFRDGRGKIGLLEQRCSHRGVSLEFGKIMDRGISCCYHGWQFDIDGTILDTPGEPEKSKIKKVICHGAYPTHEHRGLIFAYMGPPNLKPIFPTYDAFEGPQEAFEGNNPDYRLWSRHNPCNWLQVRENEMDPAHLTFLHTRLFGTQFAEVYGKLAALEWQETPLGMIYIATRRWKDALYVRSNDMILPNVIRVAGIEDAEGETLFDRRASSLNWVVPIDDWNCITIGYSDINKKMIIPGSQGYIDRMAAKGKQAVGAGDVGQTGDPTYDQRQRCPGDWDAWVSQGKITNHFREHLGSTDAGINMYRQLLRREIKKMENNIALTSVSNNYPIKTYCHNTVIKVPKGKENEENLCLLVGREITKRILTGHYSKDTPGAATHKDLLDFACNFRPSNNDKTSDI